MEEIYKFVYVSPFYDDVIDAYRVYDEHNNVIALIGGMGYVDYNNNDAKICPNAQKVINNFIDKHKLREKKRPYDLDY